MKSFKIRVNSPEHSEKIQKHLFSLGYSWKEGKKVLHTERPYLTWNEICRTIFFMEDQSVAGILPNIEVELVEFSMTKIVYDFQEVSKRNVVKVGELSYYEDELAEALKNIKPI